MPGRSGLEGATVRWHGYTNQPEPDTAPPSVNEAPDTGQLWGGLIGYKPAYTTFAEAPPTGTTGRGLSLGLRTTGRKRCDHGQPI